MPAEIVIHSKRGCRACRKCLDAIGKNLLLLIGEALELALTLAGAHGGLEIRPEAITDVVPKS